MHPLTSLYSRLISLCGLSLRLGGVAVVGGMVYALCHGSGLLDVAYSTVPPLPVATLATFAQRNPIMRIEAAVFGSASWTDEFSRRCGQLQPRVAVLPVSRPLWKLVWEWLSAPHPLAHNPFPALRAARWQETRQTFTLFVIYYLAHLVVLSAVGVTGLFVWVLLMGSRAVRWLGRPRTASQLSEKQLQRTPVTLPITTSHFLSLRLPPDVVTFVAACRTARFLMGVFAAHQAWPASLAHHGDGYGGLFAHTLRAFRIALAHPGANDPDLRVPFLLTVLAHDVGKVLAYTPRANGGYRLASYYHANRSADLLMAAGVWREFAPACVEAMLTALRASAAPSLVPIPENAPPEASRVLTWLSEVDRQAVSEDVADLHQQMAQANIHILLPRLFAAGAPTAELPAPLYREGGTPYLLREPARAVVLQLLQLDTHPGARATTGRKDPVWERLKEVLRELGATNTEQRVTLPSRQRPFSALAIPPAVLEEPIRQSEQRVSLTEVPS